MADSTNDRHIRRSGADYARAFANLLPIGTAWSRDPDSVLMMLTRGQAEIWGGKVDPRAADLLETETDPRKTNELLPEWERAFGLPDLCVPQTLTSDGRRAALVEKMTRNGGQSIAYFNSVAAELGKTATITEYSPFMCGVSQCGDTRPTGAANERYYWETGPAEMRFYWKVKLEPTFIHWFRAGSGRCGVDPMVLIGRQGDIECLFKRWKPAQTQAVFDYSVWPVANITGINFRVSVHQTGVDPLLKIISSGVKETDDR